MDFKNEKNLIILMAFITISFLASLSFLFVTTVSGDNITKEEISTLKKVSFVGVGDNLIHDSIYNAADRRDGLFRDGKYNFNTLYQNIKDDISKYDLRYINQESIIAGDKFGIGTYPKFNTPESMIPALKNAGFNVVNLANNHSLDRGVNGIKNSLTIWKKSGIYHTGLYSSKEDRERPLIIEKNGIKIALLSYTFGTNGLSPDQDFRVSYLNEKNVKNDVARVKPLCDFIVVSAHWGEEGIQSLDGFQTKYSKLFNELGVDVVLGAHVHKIQKVEWLTNKENKKTLVYFGLGNFVHNMLGANTYLEGMGSWTFVKYGDKKYIENAKFTPLVFHLESNQYGLDGSVYRLDKYPLELAKKHITMYNGAPYILQNFKNMVRNLVPKEMIDMN